MKTLDQKIEDLKIKHAEEVEAEIKLHDVTERLNGLSPEFIKIHPHVYGGDFTAVCEMDTFDDAVEFFYSVDTAQIAVKYERGLCVLPVDFLPDGILEHERTKVLGKGYFMRVRGKLYADRARYTIIFFAQFGPYIVKFECECMDRAAYVTWEDHFSKHGNFVDHVNLHDKTDLFNSGSAIGRGSNEVPNDFYRWSL